MNAPSHEIQVRAQELLIQTCETHPMGYTPTLEWRRMPVTAGIAIYSKRTIALSAILMTDEQRLRTTLLHEYAHLLAFHRHGRKGAGHGPPWRQAMIELGLDPKVHHNYEVKRNKARQEVIYSCKKCGTEIVRKRRLTLRRRYYHVRCGGQIAFLAIRSVTDCKNDA